MVFDLLNYPSVCAYFSSQFATQKASEMKNETKQQKLAKELCIQV